MRITATASATTSAGNAGELDEPGSAAAQAWPVPDREAARDERGRHGEHERAERLERDRASPRRDCDDHEPDRPQPQQVVAEAPDRGEPAREARQERLQGLFERRRRVGDDEKRQREQRRHEQQDVGGAAEPRMLGRRRVDAKPSPKRSRPWPLLRDLRRPPPESTRLPGGMLGSCEQSSCTNSAHRMCSRSKRFRTRSRVPGRCSSGSRLSA